MRRRSMVLSLLGSALSSSALAGPDDKPGPLHFPSDFGAHPQSRTEWWYATGSLQAEARLYGFQITFFRTTTGVAADHPSRFAASQLVFAHAALTDLDARRLRHDERIARGGFGVAAAATGDTNVVLRDWTLERTGSVERSRYLAHLASARAGFAFDLSLETTQPLLLQGIGGVSQKGPRPRESSRYYSQPQLAVAGALTLDVKTAPVHGRAWLDHEWSDAFLDTEAVGWDWIGMNLDDGSALTAFRLRRRDGSALYAGGSWRRPGETTRNFGPAEVAFETGRLWTSQASKASYPIDWAIATPVGRFIVKALQDDQELDSRASTGAIYWEGLSDLFDARGERVGRGYLEMTGYAMPLTL
ncbi:MAG TPA: carotenoid 1,2-hydratase [Caldimonas sp.]